MVNALGPGKLTIGESGSLRQFAANCTAAALEPSYSDGDVVDLLDGSQDREPDDETWGLVATVRQDLTLDSLEDWCLENAGSEMPFEYQPVNTVAKSYKGTLTVRAIKIGGDVKAKNTSDVSFPLKGAPTKGTPTSGA